MWEKISGNKYQISVVVTILVTNKWIALLHTSGMLDRCMLVYMCVCTHCELLVVLR